MATSGKKRPPIPKGKNADAYNVEWDAEYKAQGNVLTTPLGTLTLEALVRAGILTDLYKRAVKCELSDEDVKRIAAAVAGLLDKGGKPPKKRPPKKSA